jgi:hypothetical protein
MHLQNIRSNELYWVPLLPFVKKKKGSLGILVSACAFMCLFVCVRNHGQVNHSDMRWSTANQPRCRGVAESWYANGRTPFPSDLRFAVFCLGCQPRLFSLSSLSSQAPHKPQSSTEATSKHGIPLASPTPRPFPTRQPHHSPIHARLGARGRWPRAPARARRRERDLARRGRDGEAVRS